MTRHARAERTVRLLTVRLEELASALERSGAASHETVRLVELASVATTHAVALELLTPERADEVWREAEDRHPALASVGARRAVHGRVAA